MLITWFQMLKLMFQQRQRDAIEAASQGLIPILKSNFQNRRSGINFMTFGPLIPMPLAQIEIVKESREGKGRVIYKKVLVCFSVLERENWALLWVLSCPPSKRVAVLSFKSSPEKGFGGGTLSHVPDVQHTRETAVIKLFYVFPKSAIWKKHLDSDTKG